jgi:hypothetical protein
MPVEDRRQRGATLHTKLLLLAACALAVVGMAASSANARSAATQIPLAGTGQAQTGGFVPSGDGDVTHVEFAGESDEEGTEPFPGTIVDRSLSNGTGNGVSVNSGQKAKSNPTFKTASRA